MSCYGGGFASIPAYIGDIFGTKELGAIHGYILTAWAARWTCWASYHLYGKRLNWIVFSKHSMYLQDSFYLHL